MTATSTAGRSRPSARKPTAPSVGFVSLGCPKALVDSELIITQLRAEGYATSPTYEGADLVIVNTCGFIDSAVRESLDAIGEALAENGKVIVTGCLGARSDKGENLVARVHPKVLAVTGPHATSEVLDHVHRHLPKPHDPYTDLVPPAGIKLTPRHYAYLKISEGCNHRCSFCIIPSMRGDLVSRPIGQVMREAENLVKQGVREILVISQDTSAYGVDLRYKLDFVGGRAVRTRMTELVRELAQLAQSYDAWVRLHYVYPYPHVDEVIPLMAEGKVLPYLDVPFQHSHPRVLKAMKRPASGERNIERIRAWRAICPDLTIRSTFIAGFPGETEAEFDAPARLPARGGAGSSRLLRLLAGGGGCCQCAGRSAAGRPARRASCPLHAGPGGNLGTPAAAQGWQSAARAARRGRADGRTRAQRGRCSGDRRGGLREDRPPRGRCRRFRRRHRQVGRCA